MQYIKKQKRPWKVQIHDARGELITKSFLLKEDAKKFEDKIIRERDCIEADIDAPIESITVGQCAKRFIADRRSDPELARSSLKTDEDRLSLYWLPKFQDLSLRALSTQKIEDHLLWLMSKPEAGRKYDPEAGDFPPPGISRATRNRAKVTLSVMFKWAIKKKFALTNPVRDITSYSEKVKTRKTGFWETLEEAETYIKTAYAMNPVLGLWATIKLYAGPRNCESLAITHADIDEKGGLIWIRKIVDKHDRNKVKERTKGQGEGGDYTPPLFPRVIQAIRRHLEWTPFKRPQDFLIHNADGSPMTQAQLSYYHDKIIKKAKLKRITMHDMRRTYASHAEEAGFTREDIQLMLGHSDMRTTQNYIRRRRTQLVEKGKTLGFAKRKKVANG